MERRLAGLAEASARIFAAESLADTLRNITDEARRIIGAHQCVMTLTAGGDWSRAIRSASLSEKYAAWRGFDAKPSGKGVYAAVCRDNRPMRLTQADLEAHPEWRGFGAAKEGHPPPLRGWLAAPLIGRDGGNLGLIQLSDRHEGEFDAEDEAVLVSLARLAAVAVENIRLIEASKAAERRFLEFAEIASDWLWETDAEHRFTFFAGSNGTLDERPYGRTRWAVAEADLASSAWQAHLADLEAHRPFRDFEYTRRDRAGRLRYISVNGNPIFAADGSFIGYRGVTADVTARREAEGEARRIAEQYRSILASISDGFVALDNDLRFTFINAAAERMWRRRAEDMLGKTIFDTLSGDRTNPFHASYLDSKRTGEAVALTAYSEILGTWHEVRGYPHAGGYSIFFHDVGEERRAHRALLNSQRKLESAREMNQRIFETSLDIICITDRTGTFLQINPGAAAQFGYPMDGIVGRNVSEFVHPDDVEATRAAMRAARRSGTQQTFENRCLRKDRKAVPTNWSVSWSESEQKYFLIGRDISERVAAEERLHRAQRLEAVGQLTGGIAHDFNNLLTVIMGNSDMLARALKDRAPLRRQAELSLEAARRAAELTAQLLAFARRQTLAPRAVEPNKLVLDLRELIQRTLGAQIDIALKLEDRPWRCKVDSTQLETALLNLALNARDAMPEGGTLAIATSHRTVDAGGNGAAADPPPGDYVVIEVSDTGVGMTPEVLARVFEPFFTTKDIGEGSGLGLAMVYGFVQQSGGHVAIASEPGRGTTVSLFFPRAREEAPPGAAATPRADSPLPGGGETILVVEDDPAVRELVTDALARLGYRVLVAGNGATARNILFGGEKVDLLFTDIMMPGGVTGTQLAAEAETSLPGLRILFTSGYADIPALAAGPARTAAALLRKPYKTRELALAVRRALDHAA